MAINQITQIVMPDGEEMALVGWTSRPIYSSCDMLSGFTDEELRLFTYGRGDIVTFSNNIPAAARRTATLRDTNLDTTSEMDSMEEYLVYEIKCEVFQFNFNDQTNVFDLLVQGLPIPRGPALSILQQAIVLELEISQKNFPQAGLGWFPAGGGVYGFASTAAAGTRTYGNNGYPSHQASYTFPIPLHMGGTEDYTVILHNPQAAAVNFPNDAGAIDAAAMLQPRVYLCGLHKRPTG